MATALNTIKNWFKTGLKPTQAQFWATWDSFWHKDEQIPINKIEQLTYHLGNKADAQALSNHLNDPNAHSDLFSSLQNRVRVVEITSNTILGVEHQGCILSINATVTLTIPAGLNDLFVSCVIDVISGTCTLAHETGVEINGGYSLILNAGEMTSLYKRTAIADLYRLR